MTERLAVLVAALLLALCGGCALFDGVRAPAGVQIVFRGNAHVSDDELLETVAFVFEGFAAAPRPQSVVDDAAFEIELHYRALGYATVRAEWTLDVDATPPRALFTIEEGPRVRIGALEFPGVPADELPEVRAVFLAQDADADVAWLRENELRTGQRAVEAWYRQRGHVHARVAAPALTWSADRTSADVRVAVEPGPAFRLRAVDVEVAQPDGGVGAADLAPTWRERLGAPFDERLARALRGRIADALGERGFPDAQVEEVSRTLEDGGARLALRVTPGPRVRIGAVRFHGQEATRTSFLEARVDLEPGAWYSRSAERKSASHLQRSGIFDRVALELAPAAEPDPAVETRDVDVDLVEGRAIEVFLEPGYGSYEHLRLGAGVRHNNLFGTGRSLDLSGSVSELAQRADLSLIDPWLFGDASTTALTLFANRRQEPSFLTEELGVEFATTWRLSDALRLRTGWQYRRSNASDVEADDPALDQDVDVSEVSIQPTWDQRDTFNDPRHGALSRLRLDVSSAALGSQLEYVRLRLEHAHYVSFGERTTLALSADVGWMTPIGATDEIPIQERFFNGGENSVRSFRESQLGPKDAEGDPVGGEAATTFSAELRQRLTTRLQGALFVDAGTVELRHEDVFDFTDVRAGVGLGLRYMLPIGPIRLDGAINPDPHEDEARGAVHLSVGFAF